MHAILNTIVLVINVFMQRIMS